MPCHTIPVFQRYKRVHALDSHCDQHVHFYVYQLVSPFKPPKQNLVCTFQFAYRPTCYMPSHSLQSQQRRFVKSAEASNSVFKSIIACYIISNFGIAYIISVHSADFNDVLIGYIQLKFVERILIFPVST
jgi:hypothetical protein